MKPSSPNPRRIDRARRHPALAGLAAAIALGLAAQAQAATFTVTTLDDSGAGSLRDAVALANVTAGPDSIAFAPALTGTIALTSRIDISESLSIDGPGRELLALDGGNSTTIFRMGRAPAQTTGVFEVGVEGLTLQNGLGNRGGCIEARSTELSIVDSRLTGCDAEGAKGGGRGGAIASFAGFVYLYNLDGSSKTLLAAAKGVNPGPSTLSVTGSTLDDNHAAAGGGAIYADIVGDNERGSFRLVDSIVSGNTSRFGVGGGLLIDGYEAIDIELRDSTISGNSTQGETGGGADIWAYDGGSTITLVGGTVSGNTVDFLYGGYGDGIAGGAGVSISSSAAVGIDGTVFENNSATFGELPGRGGQGSLAGGGLLLQSPTVPSLTMRNARFTGNAAPYASALGVTTSSDSPKHVAGKAARDVGLWRARSGGSKGIAAGTGVRVEDSTFDANIGLTGAILSTITEGLPPPVRGVSAPQMVFERVTVSNNVSGQSYLPAALTAVLFNGTVRVIDSTISGNTGGGVTTAVVQQAPGEVLLVDNSTVVDNGIFGVAAIGAEPAGLAWSKSTSNAAARWGFTPPVASKDYPAQAQRVAIRNSIVTGHSFDGSPTDFTGDATNLLLLHSIIGMPADALAGFEDGDGNQFEVDPLLAPLADNGGPTFTHLPLAGSPAIDAGDPAFAEPPSIDQRGEPRIAGAALDIGAVEVAQALPEPGTVQFDPPLPAMIVEVNPNATLLVTRTGGTDGVATVAYATNGITATAGADYVETSGTLTWADGDGEPKTIAIAVIDDSIDEADETLGVTLSNATGVALGDYIATTLTIVDDDAAAVPGVIGFTATSVSVDETAGTATLSVARTGGDDGAVSVTFASSNGTATAGADYTAANGTLSWADGDSAPKTITVPILDDTLDEANETFGVTLSAPTGDATLGAAAATVTILDNDDAAGTVGFDGADPDGVLRLRVREDGTIVTAAKGVLTVTVSRTAGSAGPASVAYATVNGTATAPSDYAATSGTLTWGDGETGPKAIAIPIVEDDGVVEPDETFGIVLSNAQGAGLDGDSEAQIVIVANGTVVPPAAPAVIPTGDWRGKLALFGAMLLAGFVALRRRVF